MQDAWGAPERKLARTGPGLPALRLGPEDEAGAVIEGYASVFGERDQGGDVVLPGAYTASLAAMGRSGRRVKMLWQHDPREPIGV